MITSTPVLAFYDLGKPTLISADASNYGIGGIIKQLHNNVWKPTAFCSRMLTEGECKYAQIEKECFAGVWTHESFARYLSGLPSFQLITDHKPLISLINCKDLDQVPLCCQCLLICLMCFNPVAIYAPGKDLVIADTLSRSPLVQEKPDSDLEEAVTAHVAAVEAMLSASTSKLAQISTATASDTQLQTVLCYITNGWHNHY